MFLLMMINIIGGSNNSGMSGWRKNITIRMSVNHIILFPGMIIDIAVYIILFQGIIIVNDVLKLQQNGKQKVKQHWCLLKGNFWGSIWVNLTCRYLHINQLKNPFQMNIILCLYPIYSSVSCRPNALLR